MAAREDGQDTPPHRACSDLANCTDQASAPLKRQPFWHTFLGCFQKGAEKPARLRVMLGPPG